MTLRELAKAAAAKLRAVRSPVDLQDAFTFGGLALVTAGVHQVYGPLGYIVPGLFFVWLGLQGAK